MPGVCSSRGTPLTDEEKQRDPFALYAVCGSQFPEGDGDEYRNLCLKAKPDHATEIRRIFAQDSNRLCTKSDKLSGDFVQVGILHKKSMATL
jgi:hypothetical protein